VHGNISKNWTPEIKSNVLLSIAATNWHIAMDQQKECGWTHLKSKHHQEYSALVPTAE
jgi:hypothetical protein